MRSKKIIFVIVGVLLLVSGVFFTVTLTRRRQELKTRAQPATSLSLEPAAPTAKPGERFTLDVVIDTGENIIAAAELHLSYSANYLSLIEVSTGPFLGSPVELQKDTAVLGKITYILGAPPATPKTGKGVLAHLVFLVKEDISSGVSAEVAFLPETRAAALREGGQNVVFYTASSRITIAQGPTTTPTFAPATPTPTVTPSTPTPTITETPSSNPAPEPTATSSPLPAPTATPGVGTSSVSTPTITTRPSPTPVIPVSASVLPTLVLSALSLILLVLGGLFAFF